MWLVVFATSLWMAVDASRLGYDTRDVRGLSAMGPAGWFISGILLWIVAFPLYLLKRPALVAAGQMRRQQLTGGMPMLAGQHPNAGPYASAYGPPPNYAPQRAGGHPPGTQPQGYTSPHGHPAQPSGYAPPPPQPAHGAAFSITDEIIKLAELKDRGLLTEAEFQKKKTELLNLT